MLLLEWNRATRFWTIFRMLMATFFPIKISTPTSNQVWHASVPLFHWTDWSGVRPGSAASDRHCRVQTWLEIKPWVGWSSPTKHWSKWNQAIKYTVELVVVHSSHVIDVGWPGVWLAECRRRQQGPELIDV